jgi:DNA-binding NarL/FixJ family response regulator
MLPDGNGIKVLQYIRKEALPIRIVVTTGMHVGELNNVKRLHPDSLMLKPCDFDKLLEFIVEL